MLGLGVGVSAAWVTVSVLPMLPAVCHRLPTCQLESRVRARVRLRVRVRVRARVLDRVRVPPPAHLPRHAAAAADACMVEGR